MKNSLVENTINNNGFVPEDIQIDLPKVEEKIKESLFVSPILIEKIGKHILASGGKRLRPVMHLISARLSGYRGEDAVKVASAVELLHTATLLHDDVVDFSLTRRGKPSANILWGNKASILVGDYIFSQCVRLLVEIDNSLIFQAFSKAFSDLSTGEILELINEHNLNIDLDSYFEIINRKTSSLFKLCMTTGSYLNRSKSESNGFLGEFGQDFGIVFQLIDDYLDYFGDADKMGKPVMADFKEKKVTLPLIHLVKLCSKNEMEDIKEIFLQLKIDEKEELFIKGLMQKYEIDKIIKKQAGEYNNKAHNHLKKLIESPYKKALITLLEYNLTRDR